MSRRLLALLAAVATWIAGPPAVRAESCAERCDFVYRGCAQASAEGCDLRGRPADDEHTEEGCASALAPCRKIVSNCLHSCKTTTAPRSSVLRVFSDRPESVVYINGQRMGSTPGDTNEPLVCPPIPVGAYWVVVVSPDQRWAWKGHKDIVPGPVNSVEARLVDQTAAQADYEARRRKERDAAWKKADATLGLDPIAQIYAYESYVREFPDDEPRRKIAEKRIAELRARVENEMAKYGLLKIETTPPQAYVAVDGKTMSGVTPMSVRLPAGKHRIDIDRPGMARVRLNVRVEPGKEMAVSETLKPDRRYNPYGP